MKATKNKNASKVNYWKCLWRKQQIKQKRLKIETYQDDRRKTVAVDNRNPDWN